MLYGFLLILAPKSQSVFNKNSSSTLIEVIFPSQNVSGHHCSVECWGPDGMVTLHIDPVQEISGDQTRTQTYYGQDQRGARNIRGDIGGFYIL